MTSFSFDSNILIDAMVGRGGAREELHRAVTMGGRLWLSRMAWIEVLSKGDGDELAKAEKFLARFAIDEIDPEIAARAAGLRRTWQRLRAPDAVILATAQIRGRILVTRNTKDFPAEMPGIRVPYTLD